MAAIHFAPKPWLIFAGAIVGAFLVHEIGHCAVAWFHGYPAIPTPAKEYVLAPLPQPVQYQLALGGILGSVIALLATMLWLNQHPATTSSALLAGALTAPGFYTLRFILAGRGHDSTEFQEAQAALGLSYSGHAIDWLFLALFLTATVFWFWQRRPAPTARLVGRLVLGAVAALVVLVLLQSINNALFDPLFERKPKRDRPRRTNAVFPIRSPNIARWLCSAVRFPGMCQNHAQASHACPVQRQPAVKIEGYAPF